MATAMWCTAVALGWIGIGTAVTFGVLRGDGPMLSPATPRHHMALLAITVGLITTSSVLIITAAAIR